MTFPGVLRPALAAAVVLYRNRNVTEDDDTDDGDDVDFEDLAGR